MKRKEEIKQASNEQLDNSRYYRIAFCEGAEWADQTMIEKVVKWLEENADKYLYNIWGGTGYVPKCRMGLFDALRKAMEE